MHPADDVSRPLIQTQCERGEQGRHDTDQYRRHKKHRQYIQETGTHQIKLALLKQGSDERKRQETEKTEDPGKGQHDAGTLLVASLIGPPPAKPVAQR